MATLASKDHGSFYMTLPSDGSLHVFPDNTLTEFKTHLPQALSMQESEWEVALSEVIYPTWVESISESENYMDVLVPMHLPTDRVWHVKTPKTLPCILKKRPRNIVIVNGSL